MRLLGAIIAVASCIGLGCTDEGTAGSNSGKDPSTQLDGGIINQPAAQPTANKPTTMIAPVAGGANATSTNYQGRFVITAPQPHGNATSTNYQATISVTGEKP